MLKEADAEMNVTELCHKYDISGATHYNRKAKFSGMTVSNAQGLKAMETKKPAVGRRRLAFLLVAIALFLRVVEHCNSDVV